MEGMGCATAGPAFVGLCRTQETTSGAVHSENEIQSWVIVIAVWGRSSAGTDRIADFATLVQMRSAHTLCMGCGGSSDRSLILLVL